MVLFHRASSPTTKSASGSTLRPLHDVSGRAGTTPVTAVEQPVGLHLDKSKGLARRNLLQRCHFLMVRGLLSVLQLSKWKGSSHRRRWTLQSYQHWTSLSGILQDFHPNTGGHSDWFLAAAGPGRVATVTFRTICHLPRDSQTGSGQYGANAPSRTFFMSVSEIAGNHRYQGTSAARPTLSARYPVHHKTDDVIQLLENKVSARPITPNVATDSGLERPRLR